MSYKVTIDSNKTTFVVETGENILDAALNQGINLPYGCKNGFCGACQGKIISGNVSYEEQPQKLTDDDMKNNIAFFCSCTAESDLIIDIDVVEETSSIEVKTMPTRIHSMEKYSSDVMVMLLKLPAEERLQFLAGQYIDILLVDGKKRSFSLANAPHDDKYLELHLRHVPGGVFTDQVFSSLKEKDILRIEGPHGNFFYHEKSQRPMIFMAGGTGFAPVKAIVEHLIAEKTELPIYLYWGVRDQEDLYMNDLAQKWANDFPNIRYIPVLSESKHSDTEKGTNWNGKTGFVHQAITDDIADLSDYDIYACGPPIMISSGQAAFKEKGLNEDNFFFDSFEYAEQGSKD